MNAREGRNVELVRVHLPPAIARALPSDAAEAFSRGIPRRLLEDDYVADPSAAWFTAIPERRLVRFGVSGLWDTMCLDTQTAEVVCVPAGCADREEYVNLPPPERVPPHFVNSSLSLFAATASAVEERWPSDAVSGDCDASERAGHYLDALIRSIDPPAMEVDRYWSTFIDDVRMGNYYTP